VSGRKNKKTETSVFVIDDETEIYLLNGETECGNLSPAVTGDHFASTDGDMSSWALSTPVILPCLNNEGYPVQTSQMSPLINEVNEKPGPQFDYECTS
jgi:hypothetical protein